MKRIFDIVITSIGLLVLFPVVLLTAVLIKFKLGSPIFFRQPRPGLNGKIFSILKFRTMVDNVGEDGVLLSDEDRLTGFCRLLRSTSLDELPGLWNVLTGDMSLVGPRPLLVQYLTLYNEEQARRHNVKPGVTGWAQVNGRNAINWDEKFNLDVWYVDNQSIWIDMKILWLTVRKVIAGGGVDQANHATVENFKGNNNGN